MSNTSLRHTNPVGCLGIRLGAVCNGLETRNLVSPGILTSHKWPGAVCSHLCNRGLYWNPEECPFSNTNGQHIAYINKIEEGGEGGKHGVLDQHALTLREWSLARKITLRAEHIPGRVNVVADAESRAKPDAAEPGSSNQKCLMFCIRVTVHLQ